MKKINKKVVILIIGIALVGIAILYFILNFSKDDSSFSLLEKNWISSNTNNVIDINVFNDIPVYGNNGEGIIFDFLDEFTNLYGVSFNKISYQSKHTTASGDISFKVLDNNVSEGKNDVVIYEDHYVLLSKDNNEESSSNLTGVLNDDMDMVNKYIVNYDDLEYKPYDNYNDLFIAFNNGDIEYAAVPMIINLDYIIKNNYIIKSHISDLSKKYVLEINNNSTFKKIMTKYYNLYNDNYLSSAYQKYYLNTFFNNKEISEIEKTNYTTKTYTYGYVVNMPFENDISGEFIGTLSNYIKEFSNLTNTTIKMKKYDSVKKLKEGLSKGEVDIAFNYYDNSDLNIDIVNTSPILLDEIVYLSNKDIVVNSVKSLEGENVISVGNTYIYNYLKDNKVKVKGYINSDELLKHSASDSIIAVSYNTYNYYKNNKFKNYNILCIEGLDKSYNFIIRDVNDNNVIKDLFKNYVSLVNYKSVEYKYNTENINSNSLLSLLIKVFIAIIVIVVILKFTFDKTSKNRTKKLSKEDKLKYIDVMTSLKNRNYLAYNMKKWDDNVIYPQTILVIDLNNIKYINDSHGHDEGDNVIKKAANILIINQLENTDIMRTDGNEFLIYMVGYKEDYVIEYIRSLNKQLKELPHGFGATIGYSMITDDLKSVDDAINEATISMRSAKEKRK